MDSFIDIEKNLSILGTDEGQVFRIIDSQYELLCTDGFNSEVRSIRRLNMNNLIIAFISGNIILLKNYPDSYTVEIIRNGVNSKYSRVYALEVFNEDTLYFSSNYGKIYKLFIENGNWVSIQIDEFHGSNAIFSLEKLFDNIFASSDYGGGVVIWEVKEKKERSLYKINTYGNIQCIAWSTDRNQLAMVHRSGLFLLFQKNEKKFDLILEHEYPNYLGKKIIFLEEDKSFIFNTRTTIYKYLEGTLLESNLNFQGNLEKYQNKIYTIDSGSNVKCISDDDFVTVDKLEKLKLLNIGLIGHTSVGKSTLCDKFKDVSKVSDLPSTSHRKLWIHKEDDKKFIFFNDIAGQLELIPTLIPSLKRSDIILALFKSNDSFTFEILKKYIHLLRVQYKFQNKILLIRTFFNKNFLKSAHSDLIPMEQINELVREYHLEPLISIDRDDIESLEKFKTELLDSINWDILKDWVLSIQQKVVISYMQFHLAKELSVSTLTEICQIYEDFDEKTKETLKDFGFSGLDRSAIRSLILRYKEKDLIDVVQSDELILILESELFRKIKAKFYESAKENMGLVNLTEIKDFFSSNLDSYEDKKYFNNYMAYYDKEFKLSNTWLENKKEQRIFWSLITNESIANTGALIKDLKTIPDGTLEKITLDLKTQLNLSQKHEILCNPRFLLELLQIGLIAEQLSKTRGYWTNEDKTIRLYYAFLDGEESTVMSYYLFSNSENHENVLFIDNFFRLYFLNIESGVTYMSRGSPLFINRVLYDKYVKNKQCFFNSELLNHSVKYETFKERRDDRKLLLAYSNPIEVDPLRTESEILKIKEILEEIGYNRENYYIIPHCSKAVFKEKLEIYNPDFFYYSGHSDENSIFLENKNGRIDEFDSLEFINLIDNSTVSEIYLNSCSSKYILENKRNNTLKCLGYNKKIPDFQARKLGIIFFSFLIRYEFDFYVAMEKSKNYIELQEKISISYIQKL